MINWDRRPMSPPESGYVLIYLESINRFIDEDGNILHDLSDLFDVWQLDEWKRHQDYDVMLDHKGDWCELYYPSNFEEMCLLQELRASMEAKQLDQTYRRKAFC